VKWILLFIAIQIVSLVLTVLGIPICAILALACAATTKSARFPQPPAMAAIWGWPRPFWLWSNDVDGVYGSGNPHTRWQAFAWTALRNPCNNLRFVPGVSKVGRPLWRVEWTIIDKRYYAQAGWNNSGFPVLSAGINVNPW
jgi:hypothetical protein